MVFKINVGERKKKFFPPRTSSRYVNLQLHALVSILMAESGRCLAQQFANRLWEEATEAATAAYDFVHTHTHTFSFHFDGPKMNGSM